MEGNSLLALISSFFRSPKLKERLKHVCADRRSFWKNLSAWYLLPFSRGMGIKVKPNLRLQLEDWTDLWMFRRIFLEPDFFQALQVSEPLIVSVGSRNGLDVALYHQAYPTAKMVLLEPSPAHRKRIQDLLSINKIDCQMLKLGLDRASGFRLMHRIASPWGARYRLDALYSQSFFQVETCNLAWLQKFLVEPIDLLLLRVPGKEENILTTVDGHLARFLPRIHLVSSSEMTNLARIEKHFARLGYRSQRKGAELLLERLEMKDLGPSAE